MSTQGLPLRELKADAKALAVRYYELTGKPLGITGELAELEAAELLGLELTDARTPGFDAYRRRGGVSERIQIKGRAVDASDRYRGRCPSIKCGDQFDYVLTVLMDRRTLEVLEIWEASEADVDARLRAPGSKARNERASMGLSQFKSIATKVWPSHV
ncbi:MAG: hypothetical protein QOH86_1017 [Sphingomonadales bacterium]|jgi:hypothetical protein|nr:hypothetical protein [Sphingomonadales bacterium]